MNKYKFLCRATRLCPEEAIMWADVILKTDTQSLPAESRVQLVWLLSEYLHLTPASVRLLAYRNTSALLRGNITVLAEGGAVTQGSSSELLWPVGCGGSDQLSDLTRVLEHSVASGHLSTWLGTPVLGWRVLGNRYLPASTRARRSLLLPQHQQTPTPTLGIPPPTRLADAQVGGHRLTATLLTTMVTLKTSLLEATPANDLTSKMEVTPTPRISSRDVIEHTETNIQMAVPQPTSSPTLSLALPPSQDQTLHQMFTNGLKHPDSTKTVQDYILPTPPIPHRGLEHLYEESMDISSKTKHLPNSSSAFLSEPQTQSLDYDFKQDIFHHTLSSSINVKYYTATLTSTSTHISAFTHTPSLPMDRFTNQWEASPLSSTVSSNILEPSHSFGVSTTFNHHGASVMSRSSVPSVVYNTNQEQPAIETSETATLESDIKLEAAVSTLSPFMTTSLMSFTPLLTTLQPSRTFPIHPDTCLSVTATSLHMTTTDAKQPLHPALVTKTTDIGVTGKTDTVHSENTRHIVTSDDTRSHAQTSALYTTPTLMTWGPIISVVQTSQDTQASVLPISNVDRENIIHSTSSSHQGSSAKDTAIKSTPTFTASFNVLGSDDKATTVPSLLTRIFISRIPSQISNSVNLPVTNALSDVPSELPDLIATHFMSSEVHVTTPFSTEHLIVQSHHLDYSVLHQAQLYETGFFTVLPTTMPLTVQTEIASVIPSSPHSLEQAQSSLKIQSLATVWMTDTPPWNSASSFEASYSTGM